MDLIVTSGDFSTNILADVTITHPIPSPSTHITQAMLSPLHFIKLRENHKKAHYLQAARAVGGSIFPLALDTFGAAGSSFHKFLNICAEGYLQKIFLSHPTREELHKSVIMRSWRSRVSCALQKANVRLLFSKASRASNLNQLGQPPHLFDIVEVFNSWIT